MFRRQLRAVLAGFALLVAIPATLFAQNGPSASTAVDLAQSGARVQVAHLAPFSASDTTVTVTVNGLPIGSFAYKERLPYATLPAGQYSVAIYAGTRPTGTPVLTSTVALAADKDYTVLAVGDKVGSGAGNIPLQLLVLEDSTTPPASINFNLRVVHAAPFAPAAQTAVDVVLESGTPIPGLQGVPFGAFSPYLGLPAGQPLDVKVLAAGTQNLIFNPGPLNANAGDIITAVAIGGANGYPPELYVIAPLNRQLFLPMIFNGPSR